MEITFEPMERDRRGIPFIPKAKHFYMEDAVAGQFSDAEESDMDSASKNHHRLFESNLRKSKGSERIESDDDSEDDKNDYYEVDFETKAGPNSQKKVLFNLAERSEEYLKKFASKINVDKYEGVELVAEAGNKLISSHKKSVASRHKIKDKQDRATVEQVMDPKTRMILYKLLSNQKVLSIDGCISTGKEANVYYATGPNDIAYAIKIFKTSILTFKARDKYVSGEFRFRNGYSKKNPRKMVRLWAEKEYRNLLRIHSNGTILVPQPRLLKSHVLVMDFIGENGWPSPLLKDVKFDKLYFNEENGDGKRKCEGQGEKDNDDEIRTLLAKLYRDCLVILYKLYKLCKLVHADFSEFNLILKDYKDLYVIDVSQSVEHDHPRSFDFLRSDIKNMQDFFGKRHVLIGDYKEIFDWITSPSVDDSNYESALEQILGNAKNFKEFDVASEVFRQSYIPKKMTEVLHYERDFKDVQKGTTELIYTTSMGMKPDLSGPTESNNREQKRNKFSFSEVINEDSSIGAVPMDVQDEDFENDSNSEISSSSSTTSEESKFKNSARPSEETPEEKRERKKAVKSDKAEKRQTKMKKHIKKRKEKLSHSNSKRK